MRILGLLTVVLLCGIAIAAEPVVTPDQYEPPEYCKPCHQAIFGQWDGTMHSYAAEDPFYAKMFALASKETDGLVDTFCSRCHTPVGVLSGEVPPADHSKLSDISRKGVFCDFCHTIKGQEAIGNAQYIVDPGQVKRGPFGDSDPLVHKSAFSELHTKPEFCGTCHEVFHPVNKLPLETTYSEWKAGPYNTDDPETRRICQDCHMTPGPGMTKPNPGKASEVAGERPHIFTHDAVGGGGVSALLGEKGTFASATERLQAAAELAIELPEAVTPGAKSVLRVKVTNVGCGHKLPTGLTEIRQMWLEVVVKDAEGKPVFASGLLDDAGEIQKASVVYHTVVADAKGNPTPKFWLAASKVSDHRIPPKESVTETYEFKVPKRAKGPLSVDVRLRYRAAAPSVLRLALPAAEAARLPIIEMTSAHGALAIR